ncbi:N-terminal phage integrase SAM-like domain-containing protein [Aneurinibacillus aneurinilyticus]|uniref:Integrase SAM-like N-terminal domain-containing protein n=1 Tax=Aneurinibacillus aneurinilyticus TaxID=1391 RepID=A0A848D3P3_ANEAE|nr:N-terminal phage integrase SAM-like domain-containing protein [Aneurinibacillus aneurinilyticus]NMF01420.1 hypothetical protein [Aneurinibacillus aneurinilyticus]
MITKIETGGYIKESNGTIGEFLIEFMENKVKHSTRTSTYNNQIFMTKKHLLPVLGNKKLKDIKPFDIQKFYSKKWRKDCLLPILNSYTPFSPRHFARHLNGA